MADIYCVFSMQQLCRIAATMAQSAYLPLDMESYDQNVRSGLWRFGAPEYYPLPLTFIVAVAANIFVTGDAPRERSLTPALVAAIMFANLVPARSLWVLRW